jgi:retron-type reverse transcriptase
MPIRLRTCRIQGFFDNISHEKLMELIELRTADRRILRLIQKWLKAGVSEEGQWSETKVGTPQGAVVRTVEIPKDTGGELGVLRLRRVHLEPRS